MKYRRIVINIIAIAVMASCVNDVQNDLNKEEGTDTNFSFVNQRYELTDSCVTKFSKLLNGFYSKTGDDEIEKIFRIDDMLFPKHYSSEENNVYVKFEIQVRHEDTIQNYFIGIEKDLSTLYFFNYIQRFDILTVDFHMAYSEDFQFLNDCECGHIEKLKIPELAGHFNEIKSFDVSKNNFWEVDSVVPDGKGKSYFDGINEFRVNEDVYSTDLIDRIIKSDNKNLNFFFKDYAMYIVNDRDTLKHWVISFSSTNRILKDDFGNYIFLKRTKE